MRPSVFAFNQEEIENRSAADNTSDEEKLTDPEQERSVENLSVFSIDEGEIIVDNIEVLEKESKKDEMKALLADVLSELKREIYNEVAAKQYELDWRLQETDSRLQETDSKLRHELNTKLLKQREDLLRQTSRLSTYLQKNKFIIDDYESDSDDSLDQVESTQGVNDRLSISISEFKTLAKNKYIYLTQDTYSFMIVASNLNEWLVGFIVFIVQSLILCLLFLDEGVRRIVYDIEDDPTRIPFNIPPLVRPLVSVAQVLAVFITAYRLEDAVIAVILLWIFRGEMWKTFEKKLTIIMSYMSQKNPTGPSYTNISWFGRVFVPLGLKLIQGIFTYFAIMLSIVKSFTILELFKDFTALTFISELDKIIFTLSEQGHMGQNLMLVAERSKQVRVMLDNDDEEEERNKNDQNEDSFKDSDYVVHPTPKKIKTTARMLLMRRLLCRIFFFLALIGIWLLVSIFQWRGDFLRVKYPNCELGNDFSTWSQLGNGQCEVFFNNLQCNYDGGDCEQFNKEYPDCVTDKPYKIGDGLCQDEYNTKECRYDGYDCFSKQFKNCNLKVVRVDLIANGECDGGDYNTFECDWDGGDCEEFNEKYPKCKVPSPLLVGNGICDDQGILGDNQRKNPLFGLGVALTADSSLYISRDCRFDGGDCNRWLFPSCDVTSPEWLGDGECNFIGGYNTKECGWDGGDCLRMNAGFKNCTVLSDVVRYYGGAINDDWIVNFLNAEPNYYWNLCVMECNYFGGRCINDGSSCDGLSPPFISRGYCRPECGIDKEFFDCIYFQEKYPNCNATKLLDFTKIGDGVCDYSEYNTPECGYEDQDCVIVKPTCEENRSFNKSSFNAYSIIGNGQCDLEYNTIECGFDGGDCLGFREKYRNCTVQNSSMIDNGNCDGGDYNTMECGFDGGDCLYFNAHYPNCTVQYPSLIGDGKCIGGEYNTIECGFDGGDCSIFNENYPNCTVQNPSWIGDGWCEGVEYNTIECGFDGGDCLEFNSNYPNCTVEHPFMIDNGYCDGVEYNTIECGFDGGDCIQFRENYPNCTVEKPSWIGDGYCNGEEYDTLECGFDGGDCFNFNEMYPTCSVENPSWIGDGYCNEEYNTMECGFDGGDCINFNEMYPSCTVEFPSLIGDGQCYLEYNTIECGFDGGDCIQFNEMYPNCTVSNPSWIDDDYCDGGAYNTIECGFDGGDCLQFNEMFPYCTVEYPSWIGDGNCDGGDYNTIECGVDGGDCIDFNN